jgi:predicted membrane-bound mannosyltransferase
MSRVNAAPRRISLAPADGKYRLAMPGLALVVGVAILLRTHNLTLLPIFTDEAIYLHWALDIWEQRTRAALLIPILDDGKQPLFMWLAGGAMQVVSDPLAAGRLVSAVAGVSATVGMFLAGRLLARRAGCRQLQSEPIMVSPHLLSFLPLSPLILRKHHAR